MSIPFLDDRGKLRPGLHSATLQDVERAFAGNAVRIGQLKLIRDVIKAASYYPSIKHALLWGSFVTEKHEPRDVDYSLVVDVDHDVAAIEERHKRFLVPSEARITYGADRVYVLIRDYPLDVYVERLDFICADREGKPVGLIEISLRGEKGILGDD